MCGFPPHDSASELHSIPEDPQPPSGDGCGVEGERGGANCTGQSTVQITDILSVYRSAVHPCVSAAAMSAENFLSALRDVMGG